MSLSRQQKRAVVADVAALASQAHSAIAAEYIGLTVAEMTEFRKAAREGGVCLRVVKNTLARRALENTDFECMCEGLAGPLILAFSEQDPAAAARVVSDFGKRNAKLAVKLIAMGGKLLDPSEVARLAKLPTREQALAILMGVIRAPIEKLARTLAEPHGKLVRTVAAIRDQKQAA